ncbi:MAG TPA: preprotein translocase subunit SecD [Methanothrix sp.]|nr:preprotein translocase subunit SecD [Methanothrix sp.]HPC89339.1 preprotein translocase subunit SecD [Methanothrix sp.]HQI68116.1 preprotein translocase subunit SecD [Methanothrix sp.]
MTLLENLSKDRRVVLYVVVVALAIICIGAFGLKFGLDLEGGSYLQLKLQGATAQIDVSPEEILKYQFNASSVEKHGDSYVLTVPGKVDQTLADDLGYSGAKVAEGQGSSKITIQASPQSVIVNYLKKSLDTDVKVNYDATPVTYEIRTNVTRESLNELLAHVGGSVPAGEGAFVEGVSQQTVEETKSVLDSKLNRLGLQDIKVKMVDNKYILIDLAGMDVAEAQEVVGKPGKFEIRIQTENNESMHVLYGDAVESVEIPGKDQNSWGVPFVLSEEGAAIFQKAAIDAGATRHPEDHYISMYLDKDEIFSAPLAPELADSLSKAPTRNLEARVGGGDEGSKKAKELYIHLREGALPVNVEVVGSGQVPAALGEQFKLQMVIAGIIALLTVAGMVYYRYRERRIVLPMVMTSFSEVVMLLGVWALAGWQLDLASLAGIIMVIGTGVDQLVIITDELMRGGEAAASAAGRSIKERAAEAAEKAGVGKVSATSSKVYLTRLSRAFVIILGAAATTAAAMLPLLVMGFGALTGFALIIILGVILGTMIARPAYGRIIGYIMAPH